MSHVKNVLKRHYDGITAKGERVYTHPRHREYHMFADGEIVPKGTKFYPSTSKMHSALESKTDPRIGRRLRIVAATGDGIPIVSNGQRWYRYDVITKQKYPLVEGEPIFFWSELDHHTRNLLTQSVSYHGGGMSSRGGGMSSHHGGGGMSSHHGGGGGMSMMSLEDTPGAFYEKLNKCEKIVGRTYAGKPVYEVCQAIAGKMQCRIVDERGDRVYSHQYAKK